MTAKKRSQRRSATEEERAAGVALERAMSDARLTQAALAELIGVTPGAIQQWTSAYMRVTPERAEQLASILGVPPGDISVKYRKLKLGTGVERSVREPRLPYRAPLHRTAQRIAELASTGKLHESELKILLETAERFAAGRRLRKSTTAKTLEAVKKAES